MIVIIQVILLALLAEAQLTVDDDNTRSCESSTSDDVVNLIKESWRDLKRNVQTACAPCASNQPKCSPCGVADASDLCE